MMLERVMAARSEPVVWAMREQARIAERRAVFVTRFGDAVGVDDEEVLRLEAREAGRVFFAEFDAEWHVVGFQALDGAVGAAKDRRIVTRRKETQGRRSSGLSSARNAVVKRPF